MNILIPGGSGLIGQALAEHLTGSGHQVTILSRNPATAMRASSDIATIQWDGATVDGWGHLVEDTDAIVNLAGESIAGNKFFPSRWTEERLHRIMNSRMMSIEAIESAIRVAEKKPHTLIQASAIGYYGALDDQVVDESSTAGEDLLADICQKWEDYSINISELGVRRAILRTGIVLTTKGGALTRLMMPFKFFAGGKLGSGKQYLSWIHINDMVRGIQFLLEDQSLEGAFNLTSPNPETNASFAKVLGNVMRKPAVLPMPGFLFKAAFGNVSTVVLDGQRVVPRRLLDSGYSFQYAALQPALENLIHNSN